MLALAALALLVALLGAACEQLDPANRAANVPGVTNGKLPMSYLSSTADGCIVYDEAIASMKAMIRHAAGDGVKLRGTGCYRDYESQVRVRQEWCDRGQCQMAAVPGTSNHGWGKAVDFADQNGTLTFDSAGYAWLKAWAAFYGWIHPASMEPGGPIPEPWHWEWIGDGGKMFPGKYFGIGNAALTVPRGQPFGWVDSIEGGVGTVDVVGWAIDPDQVASIPVHVYIDSASVAVMANGSRPDVNAAYPLYADADHGFRASLPATPGVHQVCIYAINMSGTGSNPLLGCALVTVQAAGPAAVTASEPPAPAPTTTVPAPPPAPPTTLPPSTTTTSTVGAPGPTTTLPPAQATTSGSR